MEIESVNPSELEIDPLNERNENVGPRDDENLEESVRKQGIIQPPIARRHNGRYKVVVGQRRVLAAQSVGLDEIPVIIMEWDDAEALQATITENVEGFRKAVSPVDRAAAIGRLMDLNDWGISEVSKELGISSATVGTWIERTRDDWAETVVHVDPTSGNDEGDAGFETTISDTNQSSSDLSLDRRDLDRISDTDLQTIRTATESPEERERVVTKVIQEELTQREVREAKKRAERGEGSFEEVIETISQESDDTSGEMKIRTEIVFTGDYAEGLQRAARDYGTSEEEIIREAIGDYLSEQGYL